MSYYLRNTKFKSLLNHFNKYIHEQTISKLNTIQSKYNYSLSRLVEDANQPGLNYLESLFKDNLQKDKLNRKYIPKNNYRQQTTNYTNKDVDVNLYRKTIQSNNMVIDSNLANNIVNITKPIENIRKYINPYLETISKKYSILENKKTTKDRYSIAFFEALSNQFLLSRDKMDILKTMKLDIITIFRKEELFKKGVYSAKDFKKADIDEVLTTNAELPLKMLKVYGDVLDTNIVYLELDIKDASGTSVEPLVTYLNRYIANRATICILEDRDKIYSLVDRENPYILGSNLRVNLGKPMAVDKNNLEKKLLEDIQNVANGLGITIKKEGKTGLVNKKKEELISEILGNK